MENVDVKEEARDDEDSAREIGMVSPDLTIPLLLPCFRVLSLLLFVLFFMYFELRKSENFKMILLVLVYLNGVLFSFLIQSRQRAFHGARIILHFIPFVNTFCQSIYRVMTGCRRCDRGKILWSSFFVSVCAVSSLGYGAYYIQKDVKIRLALSIILLIISFGYELYLRHIDREMRITCLSFSLMLVHLYAFVLVVYWHYPFIVLFLYQGLLYYVVAEDYRGILLLRRNDDGV